MTKLKPVGSPGVIPEKDTPVAVKAEGAEVKIEGVGVDVILETEDKPKASKKKAAPVKETRQEKLESALGELRSRFGKESVSKFGGDADTKVNTVSAISTGILAVDRATRIGGIPRGRITEIYGPESSGKTTICLHTVAEAKKMGLNVLYVDLENALEATHMINCGVNELDIVYPESAEDALQMVEEAVKTSVIDLIIVDSVSALSPRMEQEKEIGKTQPGRQAALMSESLRRLVPLVRKSGATIIFINQIRMKIGVMFGSPETTSGGNALRFYASMRIDTRKTKTLKSASEAYANMVRVRIIKNKVAPPFGEEEFTMFYLASKTIISNALEIGAKLGVVKKNGNWFEYNGENLGNGVAAAVESLLTQPDVVDTILKICRDPKLLFKKTVAVSDVDDVL